MLQEKDKADQFVDQNFDESELTENLKQSNYFMNPEARRLLEKQVIGDGSTEDGE